MVLANLMKAVSLKAWLTVPFLKQTLNGGVAAQPGRPRRLTLISRSFCIGVKKLLISDVSSVVWFALKGKSMNSAADAIALTTERGIESLRHVDYRLAKTPDEKEAIYRLRYRAYLEEGAVRRSEDQRVTDVYDGLPNSWTFGVYFRGELCSSIRISVLNSEWRESCSAQAFGEILHPRLDRGEVIIDPARFVADPDRAKRFPGLPYVTLRLAYLACEHFNADLGLAIVRAEHQAFYRRVFLHETIAEPRLFPGLLKPVGLMAAKFPSLREKVFKRHPMMRSTAFERRMLFESEGPALSAPGTVEFRSLLEPAGTPIGEPVGSIEKREWATA